MAWVHACEHVNMGRNEKIRRWISATMNRGFLNEIQPRWEQQQSPSSDILENTREFWISKTTIKIVEVSLITEWWRRTHEDGCTEGASRLCQCLKEWRIPQIDYRLFIRITVFIYHFLHFTFLVTDTGEVQVAAKINLLLRVYEETIQKDP